MSPFGYGSQPRRSSGCGGRVLIALIIAAVGFFLYLNNTEENPITGEKQRVALTPAQEVQLGLQSAPAMAKQMGGELPTSDPRTRLVQSIGSSLIQKSGIEGKSPWKFQYHLLGDNKTINAFALPGGQIFITLGLFNKLQTEAQLAGVLAHETGHVIQRHSAEQLAKGQLGQMLVLATSVGASDSNHSYQMAMIANVVNQMMMLRYSREDELEADEWGLRLMEQSGYDPHAMIEVMKILKEAGGISGHAPEMLMSHPYPDNRIARIQEYLKQHPPGPNVTEGRNLKDMIGNTRANQ